MEINNAIAANIKKHQPIFDKSEKETKEKIKKIEKEAEAAKKRKEMEEEITAFPASAEPDSSLDEALQQQQRAQEQQRLDELYKDSTVAQFDDRREYLNRDGSKLISHEDGHISVQGGRWSTPEDKAKMLVEGAAAKGWENLSFTTSDPDVEKYVKAMGKGMDIDARTAEEWEQAKEKDGIEISESIDKNQEIETQESLPDLVAEAEQQQEADLKRNHEDEAEL